MKVIAETAFNHNGDVGYLKELAKEAQRVHADSVTVQVMNVDTFCTKEYSKHNLYVENAITFAEWTEFFDFCREKQIEVIPCALDEESFAFCYAAGFRLYKLHATDITNSPFLSEIRSRRDCRLLLETQCSTYQDLEYAMGILGDSVEAIFHGYSDYPTEVDNLNLKAIAALRTDFPHAKIGFADHSLALTEVPLMAMALGYDYIEKHITLSRSNRHLDWQVSLCPEEFCMMVQAVRHFSKALGMSVKHPTPSESKYRSTIFKKVIPAQRRLARADVGKDMLQSQFASFSKDKVGVALIARLKSKRLRQKVLLPFIQNTMIEDLYERLCLARNISKVVLATSTLEEDTPLFDLFRDRNAFRGHSISVIDRMLSLARREALGGILRVTGDNPLTDPALIDFMVTMFRERDLDYIRVNNVPFGISGELFSTEYLWRLYLAMTNPHQSEYLSWFVLQDHRARKGCLHFVTRNPNARLVNLSVDYPEDYDRCMGIIKRLESHNLLAIGLPDILGKMDYTDLVDIHRTMKLPDGVQIELRRYLDLIESTQYCEKIEVSERDLLDWGNRTEPQWVC